MWFYESALRFGWLSSK